MQVRIGKDIYWVDDDSAEELDLFFSQPYVEQLDQTEIKCKRKRLQAKAKRRGKSYDVRRN